jgi:hypothetical protein
VWKNEKKKIKKKTKLIALLHEISTQNLI